jgi:hypothetical protein
VVFEGTDKQGNLHPPEWQPETNLSHRDPEADLKIFNDSTYNAKGTLDSNIPHVGEYVDVKIPDHMEEDTGSIGTSATDGSIRNACNQIY